jgi:oxalate decarboxylase/phosphoglucose isomerase-like protein (cupin superfamily)
VFGLDPKDVKKVPVGPGAVIFTKSGGIHGIENTSADKPLKFVAFLYHSA